MNKVEKYINMLEKVAIDVVPIRSAKIASAIVLKNKVISIGTNVYKSHPFQLKFSNNNESIYLHSETMAIKNALKRISVNDLKKSTMYIARIKRINNYQCNYVHGLAMPCLGCQRALASFGIKRVFYTTDTNNRYEEL